VPDDGEVLLTVDYEGGDRGLPTPDDSLPKLTTKILSFLGERDARATFFVVAAVAEAHPDLIERIAAEGHEVALHTCRHERLADLGHADFEADVRKGVEILSRFTDDGRIHGFRAPFFGLSPRETWAFDVLRDLGFTYDSSVLPVWNPVCGYFPGQSKYVSQLENGLWSVPVSVFKLSERIGVPVGGGVYLRLLPEWVGRWAARRYRAAGEPMNVYFHPYDIDAHAPTGDVFGRNMLLNAILHMRRKVMLPRLDRLIEGKRAWRIIDYVRSRQPAQQASNGR
jgi:polysaccharide deacetylase family protein (PEP-CTERM system associated)